MNTTFERLIFALGTNPPTAPRAEALRLREAFEALSKEERHKILLKNGKYPFLKAAKPYLPHLNPTLCSVYEVLLNSEDEHWDVTAGWTALTQGVPPSVVKDTLCAAKEDFEQAPALDFAQHLHHMLERERIERLPGVRKQQKKSHRRKHVGIRRKSRPRAQSQREESPSVKNDLTVSLTGIRRNLIALAAANRNMTEEQWLHLTIDRQAENDTGLTAIRRPAPVKAKDPKPAAKPAAKTKQEKPAKAKAKTEAKPQASAAATKKDVPKIPSLTERLRIVIGNDACGIPECIERLKARDPSWVPESKELKAYLSLALSTNCKHIFQRVKRGVYRVQDGAKGPAKAKPPAAKGKAAKKASKGKAANGASTRVHAEDLARVMENPFAAAS